MLLSGSPVLLVAEWTLIPGSSLIQESQEGRKLKCLARPPSSMAVAILVLPFLLLLVTIILLFCHYIIQLLDGPCPHTQKQ